MTIGSKMQFTHFYQSSEARTFWFNSLLGRVDKVQGSSERDSSYINQYVSMFVRVTKTRSMCLPPTSVGETWGTLHSFRLLTTCLTQKSVSVNQKLAPQKADF